ncbi:MAG: glycosyltransferase family A protein, partial [Algoriella sp.]
MSEIKISIVTPSYNRAHTLSRVYESLKNQTFKDFKWIIMDDGSTDNTSELVKSFQAENVFEIDYFWNENQHKFITVFEGIKKVTSNYFMIV